MSGHNFDNNEDVEIDMTALAGIFDMSSKIWRGLADQPRHGYYILKNEIVNWLNQYADGWEEIIYHGPMGVPFYSKIIFTTRQQLIHFKLKWL